MGSAGRPGEPLRVGVVGGSLAGLLAGTALRAAGHDVDVFERSGAALHERGAGVALQPAVAAALAALGTAAEDLSTCSPGRQVLDRDGAVVRVEPAAQRLTSWDALYRALRGAFPDERYHRGRRLSDLQQRPGAVVARFADGGRAELDVLVAADGARSTARSLLLPGTAPRYAGYVAWRGLVPEAALPAAVARRLAGRASLFQGERTQAVAYPVPGPRGELDAGRRRMNWVWYLPLPADRLPAVLTDRAGAARAWSLPRGAVPEERAGALRDRAGEQLPPVLAALVAATPDPFVQAVLDVPVPRMALGRVALVGDAACAPRPHTGFSTAKAAVDARTLAAALGRRPGDVEGALAAWEPAQLRLGDRLGRLGASLAERFGLAAAPAPARPGA
ncbi:hypothetical protein [Quadrisphaera sp. DSM 44207]|uniref:FAD binding domain-containing protein n=1 Tax=Quadrisphaera sp. DSM 44207 TaxID=1881057 RepID=UPI00089180A8|nr:hypothetical protein [Quadrisphaera sp. DSM 44207]SDQ12863.1 2-polyprenyl-6-methoxyphenol hydroxylase [Quadrisphaera sp. DSM 44207]